MQGLLAALDGLGKLVNVQMVMASAKVRHFQQRGRPKDAVPGRTIPGIGRKRVDELKSLAPLLPEFL